MPATDTRSVQAFTANRHPPVGCPPLGWCQCALVAGVRLGPRPEHASLEVPLMDPLGGAASERSVAEDVATGLSVGDIVRVTPLAGHGGASGVVVACGDDGFDL